MQTTDSQTFPASGRRVGASLAERVRPWLPWTRLEKIQARLVQLQEKLGSETLRIRKWLEDEGNELLVQARSNREDLKAQSARIKTLLNEFEKLRLESNRATALIRKVSPYLMTVFEEELSESGKFRELHLSQIWPGVEKVDLPVGCINEASRHLNHINLLYVVAVAKYIKARRVFEFGTWLGKTTYHLAGATAETEVVTLDLPPDQSASGINQGYFFRDSDRAGRITPVHTDSKAFDPAPYRGKMDFIFIDGDHTYEGVRADTLNALSMLAPDGVIIWDDFDAKNPEILKYLTELSRERPLFKIANTCLVAHLDGVDAQSFPEAPWHFPIDWKKDGKRLNAPGEDRE